MAKKWDGDPLTIASGEDFRAWREDRNYSLRALAEALDVSRTTVERWQRSEPVPPRVVLWALAALDALQPACTQCGEPSTNEVHDTQRVTKERHLWRAS